MEFIYDNQGKPFALNYSTDGGKNFSTYYYILNLQGDVVKLINASGTTVATYTYNAWGEILSSSGTMADVNPLRYRGYYYDSETGFYYLQSRYYDPVTHRFINADAPEYSEMTAYSLNDSNLFAYCGNNPVMCTDEEGEIWGWLAGAIVGAVVSAISETVSQVTDYVLNGDPISVGDILTEAAGGAVYGATVALTGDTALGSAAKTATTTVINGIRNGDDFVTIATNTVCKAAISYGVERLHYPTHLPSDRVPTYGRYLTDSDRKASYAMEQSTRNAIKNAAKGVGKAAVKWGKNILSVL